MESYFTFANRNEFKEEELAIFILLCSVLSLIFSYRYLFRGRGDFSQFLSISKTLFLCHVCVVVLMHLTRLNGAIQSTPFTSEEASQELYFTILGFGSLVYETLIFVGFLYLLFALIAFKRRISQTKS